jgi:choline dehydrogenase-like flavoprotein
MLDDRRVAIVGSGPPGAIAAVILAEAGIDVTLLEAGLSWAARGLTARVCGLTVVRLHRTPPSRTEGVTLGADPRALLFEDLAPGGLTNHWSCAVPRFSREDFLDAQRAGEVFTWPVGYDDLAPWYDRVEPLLHIAGGTTDVPLLPAGKVRHRWQLPAGWAAVREEARRRGQGLVPLPYTYGASTTVTLSGTVFNSFVRLVRPALRSGRLTVRDGARVSHLSWSGRRVDAVIFRDTATGVEHRVPCRAVVIAAGAVNTARLLLQSRSPDFPDGLGNTHGVLGRYLHDHPLAHVELDIESPVPIHPSAYLTRAPLEQSPPLQGAGCAQWGGTALLLRSLLHGRPGRLPRIGFNIFGTMVPEEHNRVELDEDRLALHIQHPSEAAATLAGARDRLVDILAEAKLRPRVDAWHVRPPGASVHYAGTCRMHASPRFGMIDAWSRLHAAPNVVVADSAAFTTGPEKNPVLTAMALSARASHRLAEDLRAGAV